MRMPCFRGGKFLPLSLLAPWLVAPASAEPLLMGVFQLFLSGERGWTRGETRMAGTLVADGCIVIGIDLPLLEEALKTDGVFPDGDLENLSHWVQACYKLPTYFTPLLVGNSAGGSLARATLARAPPGLFAGAVSVGPGTQWRKEVASILDAQPQGLPSPPVSLGDLPIIEVPVASSGPNKSELFAVLRSGDGGWAGLDKEVAAALAKHAIPVVGIDSLRYVWHAPALIGISHSASFEFHVTSWLGNDDDDGLPTRAATNKLSAADTVCLYGDDDDDSLCPTIGVAHARTISLRGGHYFDGDYAHVADLLLKQAGL